MSQNGHTKFKNLAANAGTICIKGFSISGPSYSEKPSEKI